jgi:hypothetical protein
MADRDALRNLAAEILDSPEYKESLIRRIKDGTLPIEIEEVMWAYADNPDARRTLAEAYEHLEKRPRLALVGKR